MYFPLKNTITLFEHQYGKKYDSLIIVSDTEEIEFMQSHVLRNAIIYQTIGPYYYLHCSPSTNVSSFILDFENALKIPTMISLVVIFDFMVSNNVRRMMCNLQGEYLQNSTFLFINPYDLDNREEKQYFKKSCELTTSKYITFDTQLYILNMNQTSSSLLELYRPCKDGNPLTIEIQKLNDGVELDYPTTAMGEHVLWNRRNDMMGCTLRIAYVDQFPFISAKKGDGLLTNKKDLHKIESRNVTMFGGKIHQFEPIKLLSSELNFTILWVPADDNSYGVYNKHTDTWNGLIGLLTQDKADFSNAFLTVTSIRSTAISFTTEFDQFKFGLYMARPSISPSWTTFADVFGVKYWVALFGVMLICSLTLALFQQILACNQGENRDCFTINFLSSTSIVLLSMGACDVFTEKVKRFCTKKSFQVLIFVICVFGLLNKEAYTGGLISSIVSKQFQSDINFLEDFLTQPGYQLILRSGTASVQYFSEATKSPHQDIWEKLLKNKTVAYVDEPTQAELLLLNNKNYVYFDILSQIEPIFENYPCNIIRADQTYFHRSFALGLQKNSPYLKIFNYKIRKYVESGVLANTGAMKKNSKGTVKCPSDTVESIGYETIFSAFVLFGIGIVISAIYACIEYICNID